MRATPERVGACIAIAIAAIYAFLGLVASEPNSLFSIDAAVKLLQAQALWDSGFTSVALHYKAQDIDPEFRFLPFGAPFVFHHDGAIQGVYPVSVALLNAAALSLGLPGLVLLSVVSALVALLATGQVAGRSAVPVVVLLGVGTPFWAYGVLPWEHMPALACSTVAALLLEGRSALRGAAAGILLGAAIALRGEFALLIPGLAVLHFRGAHWRRVVGAAAGLLMPLVVMAALDAWIYARPPFSHLSHAVELIWIWFGSGSSVARPESLPLLQRVDVIVGLWVVGLPNGVVLTVGTIAMVAAGAILPRQQRQYLVLVVLVVATVLLLRDLSVFVVHPDFVAGLLRVSPVLLFAFLPAGPGKLSSNRRTVEQLLVLVFLCGLLASSRQAGAQIGPRFMLPIFPLVVKLAWDGLQSYRQGASSDPGDRIISSLGFVLFAGSVAMQTVVGIPAYVRLNVEQRPLVQSLLQSPPPVVVMRDIFLINHVASLYNQTKVMLATNETEAAALSSRLLAGQVQRIGLVRERDQLLSIPSFDRRATVNTPRAALEYLVRHRQ